MHNVSASSPENIAKKRYPITSWCLVAILGLSATPTTKAALISVAGSGVFVPPPGLVGGGDGDLAHDTKQMGFNEKQGVFLAGPLTVDGGTIAPGVFVDSRMILFNHSDDGDLSPATAIATWTFSGTILGVMSDTGGLLESASSAFLGAPGTVGYPAPGGYALRGLEADDGYVIGGTTLPYPTAEMPDSCSVLLCSRLPACAASRMG